MQRRRRGDDQKDIDKEGVNRVVIAACSRRAKTEAFTFDTSHDLAASICAKA